MMSNTTMLWTSLFVFVVGSVAAQILLGVFNPLNVSTTPDERIALIHGAIVGWIAHGICRWCIATSSDETMTTPTDQQAQR